jgi:hypothetical protein
VAGKDGPFSVATLNSDADHTGQLHEATVSLSQPLPPGATLQIDATYSGPIASSAQRLLAIGAPEDVALNSDWDRIGVPFTGLRGFGNVVWYPVSSVPVILGDGARLFDEIGEHKLRLDGAHFRLRLTVEYPHGQAPTIALINGRPSPLAVTDASSLTDEVAGVATTDTGVTTRRHSLVPPRHKRGSLDTPGRRSIRRSLDQCGSRGNAIPAKLARSASAFSAHAA